MKASEFDKLVELEKARIEKLVAFQKKIKAKQLLQLQKNFQK